VTASSIYLAIVNAAEAQMPPSSLPDPGGTVVEPDTIRQELQWCSDRRAAGERIRAEAMHDLAGWLQHGKRAGLDIKEMARLAGVTRQTVYALLRD